MAHGTVCQTELNTMLSSAGFVLSGWLNEGTPQTQTQYMLLVIMLTENFSPTYLGEGRGELIGIISQCR